MLVPATAKDLRKHGQITISDKGEENKENNCKSWTTTIEDETKPGSGLNDTLMT